MNSAGPSFLLVTTKFPPSIGGMQTLMFNLFHRFSRHMPTHKLLPGRCPVHFLAFFPYATLKGIWMCWRHGVTHLLIGDGSLAPVGYAISRLCRVKPAIAVHGLDILYGKLGLFAVAPFLRRYDVVVCNSRATMVKCTELGVDRARCVVVPCGIEIGANERRQSCQQAKSMLGSALDQDLTGKTVLVHVGRLVKRKGVSWFVEHVVPRLSPEFVLVVAGDGPDLTQVHDAVQARNLDSRVFLMGEVSDEQLQVVYDAAQAFIMPNIRVPNDMEGFGIVILEAGSHGVPVVASAIEGIRDAVIEGLTGTLVREGDPEAFIEGIQTVLAWDKSPSQIREAVDHHYGWDRVYRLYAQALGVGEG